MKMKADKCFDEFWGRCIDRIEYAENRVNGETSLTTNIIAIAYEAAMLIARTIKNNTTKGTIK